MDVENSKLVRKVMDVALANVLTSADDKWRVAKRIRLAEAELLASPEKTIERLHDILSMAPPDYVAKYGEEFEPTVDETALRSLIEKLREFVGESDSEYTEAAERMTSEIEDAVRSFDHACVAIAAKASKKLKRFERDVRALGLTIDIADYLSTDAWSGVDNEFRHGSVEAEPSYSEQGLHSLSEALTIPSAEDLLKNT